MSQGKYLGEKMKLASYTCNARMRNVLVGVLKYALQIVEQLHCGSTKRLEHQVDKVRLNHLG